MAIRHFSPFILLVIWSLAVWHGADLGSARCLSLPDPIPVNDFLVENPSVWDSLVSGEHKPHAVPLTKCKSLSEAPQAFQYEFYQASLEAQSPLCESPPSQLNSVHYKWSTTSSDGVPLLLYVPGQALAVFGLLLPGMLAVAIPWLVATAVIGMFGGLWFWLLSTRRISSEQNSKSEDSEGAASYALLQAPSGNENSSSAFNSSKSARNITKSAGPVSGLLRIIGTVFDVILGVIGVLLAALAILISVLAVLVAIAVPFLAIGGVICWNVSFSVERAGPVALPDPNGGLNQHLEPMNLNLTLCKTPNLQFYVDCPETNCTELGEPYGTRLPVGEPFKAPLVVQPFQGCPSDFGPLST